MNKRVKTLTIFIFFLIFVIATTNLIGKKKATQTKINLALWWLDFPYQEIVIKSCAKEEWIIDSKEIAYSLINNYKKKPDIPDWVLKNTLIIDGNFDARIDSTLIALVTIPNSDKVVCIFPSIREGRIKDIDDITNINNMKNIEHWNK